MRKSSQQRQVERPAEWSEGNEPQPVDRKPANGGRSNKSDGMAAGRIFGEQPNRTSITNNGFINNSTTDGGFTGYVSDGEIRHDLQEPGKVRRPPPAEAESIGPNDAMARSMEGAQTLALLKKKRKDEDENRIKGGNPSDSSEMSGDSILPISSYTNITTTYTRLPPGHRRTDPLEALRNVANLEAERLGVIQEHPYAYEPVSPLRFSPIRAAKGRGGVVITVPDERVHAPQPVARPRPIGRRHIEKDIEGQNEPRNDVDPVDVDAIFNPPDSFFSYNENNRMYECPIEECDRELPSLSRIKRHYITHLGIKPYKCLNEGCTRSFSRRDNMMQHCKVHCQHANQKRY